MCLHRAGYHTRAACERYVARAMRRGFARKLRSCRFAFRPVVSDCFRAFARNSLGLSRPAIPGSRNCARVPRRSISLLRAIPCRRALRIFFV